MRILSTPTLGPALRLALAALLAPAAVAACPADSLSLGGYGTLVSDRAAVDTTRTLYGNFHAAYDLGLGRLEVEQCCNLSPTFVDVTDEYDVLGVPAGTPVSCTVEFSVSGMIQTPGGVIVSTLDAGGTVQSTTHKSNSDLGWIPIGAQEVMNVTLVAGTPQRIRAALSGFRTVGSAIDASGSRATGQLSFHGLPPGASIVSCQGYHGDTVPARPSSWGRLKRRYR